MKRILKFEKNDCAPCNMVSQFLNQQGITYETINPFDQPETAVKYRVRSVPTVIVLEKEEEIKRIIGFKPEELSLLTAI